MSEELLQQRIDELIVHHGSYRAAGAVIGFHHTHLWRVRHGMKEPGPKLLKRLKLKRKILYFDSRVKNK